MSALQSVKPEDILTLAEDTKDGTHEAVDVALTRAEAILILLSSQFDEEGMQTLSAEWIGNSICAVYRQTDQSDHARTFSAFS